MLSTPKTKKKTVTTAGSTDRSGKKRPRVQNTLGEAYSPAFEDLILARRLELTQSRTEKVLYTHPRRDKQFLDDIWCTCCARFVRRDNVNPKQRTDMPRTCLKCSYMPNKPYHPEPAVEDD
jgi:hypothetical protein